MSRNSVRRTPGEQNAAVLRDRVKELEHEVSTLKSRLDDLRKAKNSTVVKREREVIHVGQPNLGRPPGVEISKFKDLEKKLSDAESRINLLNTEIDNLKAELKKAETEKSHAENDRELWKRKHNELEDTINALQLNNEIELGELKNLYREKNAQVDDLTAELVRLQEKLELKATQEEHKGRENTDREGHITKLTNDNAFLREKIEALYIELSIKEAEWTEREDRLQLQLKKEWGERYATWMAATEKKLQELHETNQLLKSCLYKGEKRRNENLTGFDEDDEGGAGGGSAKT